MREWIETHPWIWIAIIAHFGILGTVAYLILLERKIASWVQDRIGPNRVGLGFGIIPFLKDKHMFGLGQPLADGLKFILKEDYRPKNVDRILFTVAPALMIIVIIISIAVIPWGGVRQGAINVGVSDPNNPVELTAVINHEAHGLPAGATLVDKPTMTRIDTAQSIAPDDVEGGAMFPSHVATITYRWPFQIADL